MATTISDFLLRVKVTGQSAIDSLTKSVDNVDKGFNKATTGADKFGTSIKGLGSSVVGMAGGVAGIALAIGALGAKVLGTADQIQDLSDATGISAGRLLNFKQSIIEAGGKSEDFEKMSAKLNQTLGEAANGNEKARKSFKDLGVALGDANGNIRSTDDLLPEILSALSAIPDPATRAATAVDLLGKAANKIDFTKVSAGRDLIKDAEIKALADYRGEIDKLTNSIETNLVSAFGKLAMAINKAFSGPSTTMEKFKAGLYSMLPGDMGKAGIEGIKSDIRARQEVDAESARLAKRAALATGGGAPTGAVAGTGQLKITEAGQQAIANARAQTDALSQTTDLQNKYATSINATLGLQQQSGDLARANLQIDFERDKKIADINKQIQTETNNKERDARVTSGIVAELNKQIGIEKTAADQRKSNKANELSQLQQQKDLMADIMLLNQSLAQNVQMQQLSNQNQLIGLFGDELKQQQGLMSIESERVNAVLAARNKYAALGKDASTADATRLQNEISQAQSASDMKVAILKDQLDREKALREDASAGAAQAMEAITRSMDPFQKAQMQVNTLFGSMSSAIDTFVDTGKFKFGDFAKSVIQDLIKIELKSQATKILKSLVGSIFGGFFAEGGTPPVGKPSIVGEKGPELFIPKTSGTIIPNGGGMGGTGMGSGSPVTNNYITNNITAMDSKSVAQVFAENRKQLFGTVELARKELTYGVR
jgi:lambda family phage tail tape measure protein